MLKRFIENMTSSIDNDKINFHDCGKSTVLFVLPRGETIRNFIYSGIIKRLSKKSNIILLSVFPSKKFLIF